LFTHKKHMEDYAIGCGDCHHDDSGEPLTNLKMGDEVENCIACHAEPGKAPAKIDNKKLTAEQKLEYHTDALHQNCITCHKDFNKKNNSKAAPATCKQCHDKTKIMPVAAPAAAVVVAEPVATPAEEVVPAAPDAPAAEEVAPAATDAPAVEEVAPAATEAPAAEAVAPAVTEAPAAEEVAPAVTDAPAVEEVVPAATEAPAAEEAAPAVTEAPAAEEVAPAETDAPAAEVASAPAGEIQIADVMAMENSAYEVHKKGIVQFTHKKHITDYGLTCGECHHDDSGAPLNDLKMGDAVENCIACHAKPGKAPKKKGEKMTKAEQLEYHTNALHDNCIACHKAFNKKNNTKAAPASCGKCHPKK
jgi:endogenous inhibitor of DNA gyrase (YacG/DUF329 family)